MEGVSNPLLCTWLLIQMFVDGSQSVSSLFEAIPAGQVAPPVRAMSSDDVCEILFSSGTGGLPKAVELTGKGLLARCLLSL